MGTSEIMLRSKLKGLPNLSEKVGYGFSTNGDYLAFLENTNERVRLTRGPVTTSFGHFNTDDPGHDGAKHRFHTIEDQGIPPALASLVGVGLPIVRSLSKGRNRILFLILAIILWGAREAWRLLSAPFRNYRSRQDAFKSEDELSAKMMCIAGIGRAAAVGQFRLGGLGETSLRVRRVKLRPGDKEQFYADPVYDDMTSSLKALAEHLRDPELPPRDFTNPFLTNVFRRFKAASLTVSHPLGGCPMAADRENGVVDEYGRVFERTKRNEPAEERFYKGLYIADASIIPTALGVNPSLTISALALRIAKKVAEEIQSAK
jgi:choline dehydrogenase-like flavoprotein